MSICNLLIKLVEGVLLWTEAKVALLVEPDGQRIPIGDKEPLSNVKLCPVDEQRLLCK